MKSNEYEYKSRYHIELKDGIRPKIIKMAADSDTSIIEIHSHPFAEQARFSYSDFSGFKEFVPHLFWRLKNKPYAAIVFSKNDFDSLAWMETPNIPEQTTELLIDEKHLFPNCLSLKKEIDYGNDTV